MLEKMFSKFLRRGIFPGVFPLIVGMHPGASEYAFEYQQVRPIRLADAPGCIPTG